MPTDKQFEDLIKQFNVYLSPEQKSSLSMRTYGEVQDILKNTRSDIQSEATNTARTSIGQIIQSMPEGTFTPEEQRMLQGQSETQRILEEHYGIEEAGKQAQEMQTYYEGLVQKTPGFGMAMQAGLGQISPTFLGVSRKDVEDKLRGMGVTNTAVMQKLSNQYLAQSDRAMDMTLSALNTMWNTSLVAARTAAQDKQAIFNNLASKMEDAYKATSSIFADRLQEQRELAMYEKKLQIAERYKEEEGADIISQATLNKLAAAGIPTDVATDIQSYLNEGFDYKTILNAMIDSMGKEKAVDYMKSYYSVMSRQGTLTIGMPQIIETPNFEQMAEGISPTATPEKESWWQPGKWWETLRSIPYKVLE